MINPDYLLVQDVKSIGSKALRLTELHNAGYLVPAFLVITSEELWLISSNGLDFNRVEADRLVVEIFIKLSCTSYAVRSSMRNEDLAASSQAGQFATILNVRPVNLSESIVTVIKDAYIKLPNGLHDCSIIIQDCIDPDYAGVIFTRNPIGSREMAIEYRKGLGDKVVGGEDVTRIKFLRSAAKHYIDRLGCIEQISSAADSIECMYKFPQDIEWAVKDGKIFILQTRPITSITPEMWLGINRVDLELPRNENFYFEKTALNETFNHPRPLAFSILQRLHDQGGPIMKAYKNIGCKYIFSEKLFHLFCNDLFIDKHVEIQTLFPALGYKRSNTEAFHWETWSGLLNTARNYIALSRISLKKITSHENELRRIHSSNNLFQDTLKIKEALSLLIENYSTIFEINIFAQKAFRNLEKHFGRDSFYVSALLSADAAVIDNIVPENLHLRGNSLNIDDVSIFISNNKYQEVQIKEVVDAWWNSLPKWKQIGLAPYISNAKKYMKLRESARLLSVKHIECLRRSVEKKGVELFHDTPSLVFFATIHELINETVDRAICVKRMETYKQNILFDTPSYFASFAKSDKEKSIGISPGVAKGLLVTREDIDTSLGNKILYTDVLSPDLAQYFDSIVGIISKNGGMLSHLAIMAREARIPVVVTSKIIDIDHVGSTIVIDGLTGKIDVLAVSNVV